MNSDLGGFSNTRHLVFPDYSVVDIFTNHNTKYLESGD